MGFMKNISNLFKPDDEYEEDTEYTEEEYEDEAPVKESRPSSASRPAGGASSNASLEMKIVKPEKYEDVTDIAKHLLQRRTVVLNLESTNKETIRRIIDFLSGVAFAIGGKLNRVANSTYVITPKNVELSDDRKDAPAAEEKVNSTPRDLF